MHNKKKIILFILIFCQQSCISKRPQLQQEPQRVDKEVEAFFSSLQPAKKDLDKERFKLTANNFSVLKWEKIQEKSARDLEIKFSSIMSRLSYDTEEIVYDYLNKKNENKNLPDFENLPLSINPKETYFTVFETVQGSRVYLTKVYKDEKKEKFPLTFITFCGSMGLKNIFTDLQMTQTKLNHKNFGFFKYTKKKIRPWPKSKNFWTYHNERTSPNKETEIKVHTGFLKLYFTIRSLLLAEIIQYKSKKIIISGHSLGGALGTLLAFDLAINFPKLAEKTRLITYGSPRVGNPYFVNLFNEFYPGRKKNLRIFNQGDLVPAIPSRMQNFFHIGQEMTSPWIVDRENEPNIENTDSMMAFDCPFEYFSACHSHYMGINYTGSIKTAIKNLNILFKRKKCKNNPKHKTLSCEKTSIFPKVKL